MESRNRSLKREQENVPPRKSARKRKATEVEVIPVVPTERPEIEIIDLLSDEEETRPSTSVAAVDDTLGVKDKIKEEITSPNAITSTGAVKTTETKKTPHQNQSPVPGKQGAQGKHLKSHVPKNDRNSAPPKSFQETLSKLDDVPTQKNKKRRKTTVKTANHIPSEDVAKPSADTPDAAKTTAKAEITKQKTKSRNTLKKGYKPNCETIDGIDFGPAAKTPAVTIPAAEPSAVTTRDSESHIKTENTGDESSAQSDQGFVTVESNPDNIPESTPTEENIDTFLRQARNAPKIRSKADMKHFDRPSPGPSCSTPRPSGNNNQSAKDALTSLAQLGLSAFTAVNEPNSDVDKLDEEFTTESESHIFATEDGAEETDPCADGDATDEEEYVDAESGAATPEDMTDQNDNVTETDKPEQIIPYPAVKDIEKLFQERGWNEEEEECNNE